VRRPWAARAIPRWGRGERPSYPKETSSSRLLPPVTSPGPSTGHLPLKHSRCAGTRTLPPCGEGLPRKATVDNGSEGVRRCGGRSR
jgi:hypothetical protein